MILMALYSSFINIIYYNSCNNHHIIYCVFLHNNSHIYHVVTVIYQFSHIPCSYRDIPILTYTMYSYRDIQYQLLLCHRVTATALFAHCYFARLHYALIAYDMNVKTYLKLSPKQLLHYDNQELHVFNTIECKKSNVQS